MSLSRDRPIVTRFLTSGKRSLAPSAVWIAISGMVVGRREGPSLAPAPSRGPLRRGGEIGGHPLTEGLGADHVHPRTEAHREEPRLLLVLELDAQRDPAAGLVRPLDRRGVLPRA